MSVYPLPMRWPVAGFHIDIVIDREGWSFCTAADREAFQAQPVSDRLELRRAFEAQVELAKSTH